MQPLTRTVARTAQRLRPQIQRQSQRRFAGDHHGPELVSEGQAAHQKNPPNKNESLGASFYVALAALPASLAIYKFTSQGTNDQPYFTRLIKNTYDEYATKWARRNDLHTQAMQQAAADRLLFFHEPNQAPRTVELCFLEIMNASSPYNVPAGFHNNMDELVARYKKEAYEENERKLQQLRDNKVPAEQPTVPLQKATPAALDS